MQVVQVEKVMQVKYWFSTHK